MHCIYRVVLVLEYQPINWHEKQTQNERIPFFEYETDQRGTDTPLPILQLHHKDQTSDSVIVWSPISPWLVHKLFKCDHFSKMIIFDYPWMISFDKIPSIINSSGWFRFGGSGLSVNKVGWNISSLTPHDMIVESVFGSLSSSIKDKFASSSCEEYWFLLNNLFVGCLFRCPNFVVDFWVELMIDTSKSLSIESDNVYSEERNAIE